MRWPILLGVGLLAAGASEQPGGSLARGMVLTYESGGGQSRMRIDSVRVDSIPTCGVAWIASATAPERRHHCTDGSMLSEQRPDGSWNSVRPVAPGIERSSRRPNGNVVTYRTSVAAVDTIGGTPYPVILTEVITADSTGRVLRRLRERYSVGLMTATGGVFERPDSAGAGWQRTSEFKLVRIERN